MSKRSENLLIADILEAAEKIKKYAVQLSLSEFLNDSKTLDAVIRNFEIIGEAAKRIPEDFRNKHPSVNWLRIIGFRNRIVHDYMGIDYKIVWRIVQNDLDKLVTALKEI